MTYQENPYKGPPGVHQEDPCKVFSAIRFTNKTLWNDGTTKIFFGEISYTFASIKLQQECF